MIPQNEFNYALKIARFSIDKGHSHFALQAALFEFSKDSGLRIVTTNGHIISVLGLEPEVGFSFDYSFLMSYDDVEDTIRIFSEKKEGSVTLIPDSGLLISNGKTAHQVKPYPHDFVNYKACLTVEKDRADKIRFDSKYISEIIKVCKPISKGSIDFSIQGETTIAYLEPVLIEELKTIKSVKFGLMPQRQDANS